MKKLKILIADDNKHFLEAFKFLLNNSYQDVIDVIYEASNGDEAVQIIKEKPINLAFMDVDMPGMNGIEATKKATELNRFLFIVAISFHTEMEIVQKMIEAGARNYIIKEDLNKVVLSKIISSVVK